VKLAEGTLQNIMLTSCYTCMTIVVTSKSKV